MARKTLITRTDDLTGEPADETVAFAVDGSSYEIDVTADHAAQLRDAFAAYLPRSRRTGGPKPAALTHVAVTPALIDTRAVRAWAASNGITVNPRGRIPADVVDRFRAAGY